MSRLLSVCSFQNRYDNHPHQCAAVTWEELVRRLTRHREWKERDGELWSPVEYLRGTTRSAAHVRSLDCFVLDMDCGAAWEQYLERWQDLEFVLHSSYSHTTAAPRWRAVFPLTESQPGGDAWYPIWARLAWGLAKHPTDQNCKDPSRMYYLPSHPPGSKDHFALRHEGQWLDASRYTDPPPPPAAPVPRPTGEVPRERAGRVDGMHLLDRAIEITRGDGWHAGCKWLMIQAKDNDFAETEARSLGEVYVHQAPRDKTAEKAPPYHQREMERTCAWAYAKPKRDSWAVKTWEEAVPIPDPPAPPRQEEPAEALHRECLETITVPVSDPPSEPPPEQPTAKVIGPPTGPLRAWAPITREEVRQDVEGEEFDFSDLYNYAWLQTADVQPPPWVVEGLCPTGCIELFGHAKLGKTFVVLGLAAPVALGGVALSHFQCQKGEVLYIAAEDAKWRMKHRGGHLLVDEATWPPGFWVIHEWGERMTPRGLRKLRAYLTARPDTRMVILDPWHALRVHYPKGGDIAGMDYEAFKQLNRLGEEFGCAIVVVHHASKRKTEDGFNNSSGSHGLQAGAGTILEFQRAREEHTARLQVSGRDVREEKTWALQRNTRTGHWDVVGEAEAVATNQTHLTIWDALSFAGPMRPKALAEATGLVLNTVYSALTRMAKTGEVSFLDGQYAAKRKPGTKEDLFDEDNGGLVD